MLPARMHLIMAEEHLQQTLNRPPSREKAAEEADEAKMKFSCSLGFFKTFRYD